MMDTASPETPEQTLAKAFARHVLDWAREMTAENGGTLDRATRTLLERAAYYTSLAVSSGDTCLPLAALAPAGADDREALRASLLASGMVAPSHAPGNAPLVLDGGDRLYLHRYFDYERTLADRLAKMRAVRPVDTESLHPLFDKLFSGTDANEPDWQKIAVALALRQQLLIVSGLRRERARQRRWHHCWPAFCTPTGTTGSCWPRQRARLRPACWKPSRNVRAISRPNCSR